LILSVAAVLVHFFSHTVRYSPLLSPFYEEALPLQQILFSEANRQQLCITKQHQSNWDGKFKTATDTQLLLQMQKDSIHFREQLKDIQG
jgi:hypothetical protein